MKRGCDPAALQAVITLLVNETPLPEKYRDHALSNSRDYRGMRECHIEPDWLMTWNQNDTELTLLFLQTGTHADLF